MIKATFWIGVGYAFGAAAFTLATILDSGLGTDAVGAVIEGIQKGIFWPITFIELVTGNTGA